MIQLIYKNKLYITGTFSEVNARLKELALQFKTVKELIDSKTNDL